MSEDPLYYYVRDKGSSVAHHWDYARSRTDHALCGHPYQAPVWEGEDRPRAVCRACQALLSPHEARWWRQRAEALEAELALLKREAGELHRQIAELQRHAENQRTQLRHLTAKRVSVERTLVAGSHAAGGSPPERGVKPGSSKKRKRKKKAKVDNTKAAIARRLREETGLMSAANISSRARRPSAGRVRVVRGGLPGLGKGR